LLAEVLHEFAGRVAVYGDIDQKLAACMVSMKTFLETVPVDELERIKTEDAKKMQQGFEMERQMRAEEAAEKAAGGDPAHAESVAAGPHTDAATHETEERAAGTEKAATVSERAPTVRRRTSAASGNPAAGRKTRTKKATASTEG
jgi:hypothetical protein